ncbi:TPA: type VI secretion system baseplate subunit TssG [Xanthomonas vasicola pv. zeae]|uniref:Type VI secretion system baseplate subunit TssG n=3 Tax=Xanthomonas vasicola TaxID=56459 RepID=A0ABD7SCW7_XANVA|nr:type VI secretion system baseplate subunit TssG [Xanthomonas vasicola]AVQ07163.1 type VI secretion system baseplate subunit TssG [Xanthomonas vasicola pv. vasculorum]AZM71363.1 type VI secretion system baseplate subunit TssG [Xanthomonas vasicola pv. vasculorum]KGR42701.1 type VI secretion protein [Xanthomonas vasicola]KGR60414.1 type VI secretion protein [Xanthomonas vasicola]MDO6957421.1 type VI secretion system baseplate subunit TssG [Xanthomonas vasicola]
MASPSRQSADPVALFARLDAQPQDFELFEALRRLECAHPTQPRLGQAARPLEEPVRLGQRASLVFPPRDIDSVHAGVDGRPPTLRTLSLGLFGPHGALPLHLTEHAIEREGAGDPTFTAFADIFHHRMIALWYRAWTDARPTVQMDRPGDDRFGTRLDALTGVHQPALRGRDAMPVAARRHFAGRFVAQARNAEGLRAVLIGLFDIPVQVQQFIANWLPLPEDGRLRMGRAAARIGRDATLGASARNAQHRFRLRLGPLDIARYREFLPGSDALAMLTAAVRGYVGDEQAWDLQLVLAREDVPLPVLGQGQRIGLSLWLGHYRHPLDADQLVLAAP